MAREGASTEGPRTSWGDRVAGLVFVGFGLVPLLGSFDIGPLQASDVNGPPWLGFVAGGVFALAGAAAIAGDSHPTLRQMMVLLVLAGLAAIGSWIAFGVGDRVCSGALSVGGAGAEGVVSGLGCRIPFGIGAVVTTGVVGLAAVTVLERVFDARPALARARKAAESVVLIGLAPVLIVVLLMLIVPQAVGVVRHRLRTGEWPRNESFIRRQRERLRRVRGAAEPPSWFGGR